MKKFLVSLLKDESGLTTIEYAVGAAVVVTAAGAGFTTMFTTLGTKLSSIVTAIAT
jgi:Flp pilus assembly pilin Flp